MDIGNIAAWITIIVFAWNVIRAVWKKIRIPVFAFLKNIVSFVIRFFNLFHRWLESRK